MKVGNLGASFKKSSLKPTGQAVKAVVNLQRHVSEG